MIFAGHFSAIIVADQRLNSLGDARHGHHDDRADIGDDRIADNEFFVQICQDGMVEQKDYDSGREFRNSGRQSDFYRPPCEGRRGGETYKFHMGLAAAEMCQVQKNDDQL